MFDLPNWGVTVWYICLGLMARADYSDNSEHRFTLLPMAINCGFLPFRLGIQMNPPYVLRHCFDETREWR